jgi:Protein of unknown function (DUF3311)
MDKPAPRWGLRIAYLLLFIPYVAMMWVPYYNRVEPQLAGIPFFYWYQLLWILLGAVLLLPAYFMVTRGGDAQ